MTAIQLSDAKTSLLRLKRDISDINDISGTFVEWCNFANRQIYNSLIGIDTNRFVTSQAYSGATSGSQSLPTDLLTMRGSGLGVFLVGSDGEATNRRLAPSSYGSKQPGYYFERENIVFTGIQNAQNFVMRYIPRPATFTAETEYFTLDGTETGIEIIPEFYSEALRDDLSRMYSMWDEDIGLESVSDFRFNRTLSEMQQFISRTPRSRAVPFFNSAY